LKVTALNKIIALVLIAAAFATPAAAARFELGPFGAQPIEIQPVGAAQFGQKFSDKQIEMDPRWQDTNPRYLCMKLGGTWKTRDERGRVNPHCEV